VLIVRLRGRTWASQAQLVKLRALAEYLGGEVRDARRSVLTRQAIDQICEQI